jgi:Zn-finger nucleic acid-binding protein
MKERLASEEARSLALKCPKCDGVLFETSYDGVSVDVCDKCSGVWLDAGELTLIVNRENEGGWFSKLFD